MSNLNYNQIILGGRLVNDPELKQTQQGQSVSVFTLAVNRRAKSSEQQITDFMQCIAWTGTAEFISKYFRKGSSIMITGELHQRDYEKDGVKHRSFEILVKEAAFVDSKREEEAQRQRAGTNTTKGTEAQEAPEIGVQMNLAPQSPTTPDAPPYGDDDLPF